MTSGLRRKTAERELQPTKDRQNILYEAEIRDNVNVLRIIKQKRRQGSLLIQPILNETRSKLTFDALFFLISTVRSRHRLTASCSYIHLHLSNISSNISSSFSLALGYSRSDDSFVSDDAQGNHGKRKQEDIQEASMNSRPQST